MSTPDSVDRFKWERAIGDSDLHPVTRHVGLRLATYVNKDSGRAHPGVTEMSRTTGLGESTVRKHLQILLDRQFVVVIRRGTGMTNTATEYRLNLPLSATPIAVSNRYAGGGNGDPNRYVKGRLPLREAPVTATEVAPNITNIKNMQPRAANTSNNDGAAVARVVEAITGDEPTGLADRVLTTFLEDERNRGTVIRSERQFVATVAADNPDRLREIAVSIRNTQTELDIGEPCGECDAGPSDPWQQRQRTDSGGRTLDCPGCHPRSRGMKRRWRDAS